MNATYNNLNETVDGINGTGSADYAVRFTNSQSAIDQTVYQFEFQQAVELSAIYIGYINGNSHFINGASIKLQASNNNATWLDVNDGATYNQTNSNSNVPSVGTITNQAFEVTKNAGVYKYYRIQGVSGTIWDGGYSNEIYFETNNFNASLYPKDNCSVDTDNDGTYNHLDTDSDDDGCIDTIEAGTSNDGTTTDTNNNGLLDQYEDGITGTINYISSYSAYAIDDAINACTDTDSDGVNDVFDIDDDNDGVLDTEEGNNFNVEEILETLPIGGTLSGSTGLIRSVGGSVDIIDGTQFGVSTTPFMGTNYISFHTTGSGARAESFSIQLSEPLIAGELLNISFQAITLDDGVRAWDNSSKIHIDGGNSFGDDSVNLYITPSTGNNSEGWKNYSFNYVAASSISHITIYNVSDTNAESFVGIDNIIILTKEEDTDGDGTPNGLDLDSDGDGCSDALEAGATTNTTANYVFTGAVGANGLVDTLETSVDSGIINYTSTYNPYALNNTVNSCVDTDSDGVNDVFDIDDDNDGVLDTEENETNTSSLPVFNVTSSNSNTSNTDTKTVSGTFSYGTTGEGTWELTTDAVNSDTQVPSNFYITANVGSNNGLAIIFEGTNPYTTLSRFTYSISTPDAVFKDFQFQLNGKTYSTSMTQQSDVYNLTFPTGSNGIILDPDNQTTSDDGIPYTSGSDLTQRNDIANTSLTWQIKTSVYRGLNSGQFEIVATRGDATEGLNFTFEAFPSVDTDSDGIPNSLDLDSDGDGCSDALEAGATTNTTADYVFTGAVGANGLVDTLETSVDSLSLIHI